MPHLLRAYSLISPIRIVLLASKRYNCSASNANILEDLYNLANVPRRVSRAHGLEIGPYSVRNTCIGLYSGLSIVMSYLFNCGQVRTSINNCTAKLVVIVVVIKVAMV